MHRNARLLTIVTALILLMCYGAAATFAVDEPPIAYEDFIDMVHGMMEEPADYEGLFALSDEVDGAFAEGYYFEMNRLFDEKPDAFIDALSDQSYERISQFAFVLAGEHMLDLDTYRATLEQSGAAEETLFLMRMGILVVESNTKYSDPDYYKQTYPQQVKASYQENNRLFLLGMPAVADSFYLNVADSLIAGLDNAQMQQLQQTLGAVDGLTEAAKQFVAITNQQIDRVLPPDLPDTSGEPDIPEVPDESEQPDAPTDETDPSASTQSTPVSNTPEEKVKTSGYVWVIVSVAVLAIGIVAA